MKIMPPCFVAAMMFIVLATLAASAQTTEFTYQGSLRDNSAIANGNYDFEFALFDMLSAGSQIGSTAARNNVQVASGIFTVKLDFGPVFPGTDRYMEIRVRLAGQPGITILGPRQLLTSAPHAIKSINADNAANAINSTQLGGVAASQYVVTTDPRMTDARPPTAGSANYIQNQNAGPQAASSFNISGNGSVGGDLTVGGQLTLNIVNALTQYNIAGSRVLSVAGTDNVFAGRFAGAANSGTGNAFFGHQAGQLNTSGSSNSFFGSLSGGSNTTGVSNTFFGASAGFANVTGGSNSFFGRNAGAANLASSNSFFGAFAGDVNTAGNNNSFFGSSAGGSNTTGASNSFFGTSSGLANTTGGNNAFFGSSAGSANTIGTQNSFFGASAGISNTTPGSNSFFGAFAGMANTGGGTNSFFGSSAGISNTTGSGNSFFGQSAGFNNTTAGSNSFFGNAAGGANTTGANGAYFGSQAGTSNSTGNNNAFFGAVSGDSNTTGNGNSFFGTSAGGGNTIGVNNAFVGFQAGIFNTTGSNNTAIGGGSGPSVVSNNLTFATAIGAGATVSTSSTIVLGRSAGEDLVRIPGLAILEDHLEVAGRVRVGTLGSAGLSSHLCLNGVNDIAICSSSLRYKTNIRSFDDGLSFVNRLRPISYDWKDGGMKDVGFGAEDIAKIDTRFVAYNASGEVEGVKYDRISAVLVNAIKEQQALIEKQQQMIERLEKRLTQLEGQKK